MRKVLVIIMAVLLGVTMLAFAGCGGDTKQAQQDMKDADAAWAKTNKLLQDLGKKLEAIITGAMGGNVAGLDAESAKALGDVVKVAEVELGKARLLYTGITNLNGVKDYVDYADAMIHAIDDSAAAVMGGKGLLEKILPIVETGDVNQIKAFLTENTAKLNTLQELQKKADASLKAAEAIKTSKKLGQ